MVRDLENPVLARVLAEDRANFAAANHKALFASPLVGHSPHLPFGGLRDMRLSVLDADDDQPDGHQDVTSSLVCWLLYPNAAAVV